MIETPRVATSERPMAPSPREVSEGHAPIESQRPRAVRTEERSPAVPLSRRGGDAVRELDPRRVTEGFSPFPMLVFGLMGFVVAVQGQALAVVLPQAQAIGVSAAALGVLVSFINGAFNIGGVGLGYLADRFRIRVVFLRAGLAVRTVGALMIGFAAGPAAFVTANLIGVAGNLAAQPQVSILRDVYPVAQTLRAGFFNAKLQQLAIVIGPTLAGVVTVWVGWQWMLVLVGLLSIPVVWMSFHLREPRQGGVDAPESADTEGQPPISFGHALAMLWSIRTMRLILLAYPFLAIAAIVVPFSGIYFAAQWQLGPVTRGLAISSAGAVSVVGLIVFTPLIRSFSEYKQGRLLSMSALLLVWQALCAIGMVVAPSLPLALAAFWGVALVYAIVAQTVASLVQAIVPARIRTLGVESLSFMAIVVPLYLLVAPTVMTALFGAIGITVTPGVKSVAGYVPAMLIGAFFVARAARMVEPDIRSAISVTIAEAVVGEARAQGRNTLLVCRGLEVEVGGAQILFGVDLDVEDGEVVALLGTNGAGKSTLLRAISGVHHASSGGIFYDGEDITHAPPHANARRGIVMLPGGHAVFPEMTVADNLRAAAWIDRSDAREVQQRVDDVLSRFPQLRERLSVMAGSMSGGEQQMLAVSQALLMRPRLLMIDELSLGLAPRVVEQLLGIVREINADGTTVILVEQSVNVALEIASRVVFMDHGEVRYDGPADRIHEHREIFRAVFLTGGAEVSRGPRARTDLSAGDETALSVRDLRATFGGVTALDGVSLDVRAGEIVGLVGPNGAGKTTLFDAISGFVAVRSGTVSLLDHDVTASRPEVRAQLGLGRSFQNVRLFPALTVRENLTVALDRAGGSRSSLAAAFWLPTHGSSERRAQRRVESLIETLGLQRYAESFIGELSTGTRRIVDFGCIIASGPRVLLLDEPSSGLAQAEVEELGPLVSRIARDLRCAVLITEHDLGLVASIAARLVVMELGHVFAEGEPSAVLGDPAVQALLAGGTSTGLHRSGGRRALEPLLGSNGKGRVETATLREVDR